MLGEQPSGKMTVRSSHPDEMAPGPNSMVTTMPRYIGENSPYILPLQRLAFDEAEKAIGDAHQETTRPVTVAGNERNDPAPKIRLVVKVLPMEASERALMKGQITEW